MIEMVGFAYWFSTIPDSVKEDMLGPSAKTIGQGLNGIVSVFANPLLKLGMISKKNIEEFEKELYSKTPEIPEENRDSSKQGLAVQALEDALYRLDEEELREYYANLIAAALDDRVNTNVHPSFSTILKQMSSEDALLFKQLTRTSIFLLSQYLPLATVQMKLLPDGGYGMIYKDALILPTGDNFTIEQKNVSLSSLERLGLVKVYRNQQLSGPLRMIDTMPNEHGGREIKTLGSYDDCYSSLLDTEYCKEKTDQFQGFDVSGPEVIRGSIEITDLAKSLAGIIDPNVLK
ncbi:MAG: DUF4393 domain-containing protein [Enterococcus sp.]